MCKVERQPKYQVLSSPVGRQLELLEMFPFDSPPEWFPQYT